MCAIIDANVASQLMGKDRSEAARKFIAHIEAGRLMIVIGGKLRQELSRTPINAFIQQAILAQRARSVEDAEVDRQTGEIERSGECVSDDPHIIALARISGARLLYTNDRDLQQDFKNPTLVDRPRGRIYTTLRYEQFHSSHQGLLNRNDLCRLR